MASFTAIAPEPVHEADAHHPHALTHRHVEAHDHDGTEIEPGQGHVLWLAGNVAVECSAYHLTVAHVAGPAVVLIAPSITTWVRASILDGSPPHGPPRP